MLSRGIGELERGQAVVHFKHEYNSPDEAAIPIVSVIAVHPILDIALLELDEGVPPDRNVLVMESELPMIGDAVVTLGYPVDDFLRNPLFASVIFENKYGIKRAAPGEVTSVSGDSISHDCSTLGGNSGSPVFSMKTARVLAIHSDGIFVYSNEAIPASVVGEFVINHSARNDL
jgi:S1-C subfamily serine protease